MNTSACHLSADKKQIFLSFLVQFVDCFSFPGDDLGRTSKLAETYHQYWNSPIHQPICLLLSVNTEGGQTLIDDVLAKGIVYKNLAVHALLPFIVLVKKKDGTIRFWIVAPFLEVTLAIHQYW